MYTMPTFGRSCTLRRGTAMLMVLISLAIATIVATAYLASRDNSAMIGQKVVASTHARWSASSGIDLAGAILGSDFNLDELTNGSPLIDGMPVPGNGTLTVDVMDLERGHYANRYSHWLHLTSTVQVDGVPQVAIAVAEVDPIIPTAQFDLADFAIYAENRIDMSGDATITRWEASRLAPLRSRIHLATYSDAVGSVQIRGDAAAIDASLLYAAPHQHALSNTNATSPPITVIRMEQPVPAAAAPPADAFGALPDDAPVAMSVSHQSRTLNGSRRILELQANNATVHVQAGETLLVMEDLVLLDSDLSLQGDARIIVLGDLQMTRSRILSPEGSRFDMHIGGSATLTTAYIGEKIEGAPDASGALPYQNVAGRFLWSIPVDPEEDPAPAPATWFLNHGSVVAAQLYAIDHVVSVGQSSAIYGRVAAHDANFGVGSALYYDPALDRRLGFASQDGPMYESPGHIHPTVRSLPSLHPDALAALAATQNVVVLSGGRRLNTFHAEDTAPTSLFYPSRPRVRMRTLGSGVLPGTMEAFTGVTLSGTLAYSTPATVHALPVVDSYPLVEDPRSVDATPVSIESVSDAVQFWKTQEDDNKGSPSGLIHAVLKRLRR